MTRVLSVQIALGILGLGGTVQAIETEARRIHESALVIDGHADTPQRFLDEGFDFATDTPVSEGHLDLGKARAGNLGAEFFSIWVDPKPNAGRFAARALQLIDSVYQQIAKHPEQLALATGTKDIVAARSGTDKRLACLMGLEGGHAIENDLGMLRDFYRLGVRYMTLTWSNSNEWADSSGDLSDPRVKHHNGLTDFGKQVVREMNRIGMIVDISHVSDKTFYDVIQVTGKPVIASHSSCRALSSAARNMDDDMLRALAHNGGVVGVNFSSAFLSQQDADDLRKKITQENALEPTLTGAALDEYARKQYHEDYANVHVGHATVD